jgi:hypothetical protein
MFDVHTPTVCTGVGRSLPVAVILLEIEAKIDNTDKVGQRNRSFPRAIRTAAVRALRQPMVWEAGDSHGRSANFTRATMQTAGYSTLLARIGRGLMKTSPNRRRVR